MHQGPACICQTGRMAFPSFHAFSTVFKCVRGTPKCGRRGCSSSRAAAAEVAAVLEQTTISRVFDPSLLNRIFFSSSLRPINMFVLLVAGDLYGRKHNLEFGFPDVPALDELAGHCESAFRNESRRLRIPGTPAQRFTVDNIKIFDDSLNRWLDLTSPAQLCEWSQIYLLQPEGDSDDAQGILEPPIRIRSPVESGSNKEKFFFLFHDMDFNGNGHLNREELQRIFNVMSLYKYGERTVDQFFHQFDTNRDGVLSFAEFTKFMNQAPEVADDLLRRSVEYWEAWERRPSIRDSSMITVAERDAIQQYLERGRTVNQELREKESVLLKEHDERVLRDREEELRRAKERFVKKYGRDPASPSATTGASPARTTTTTTPQRPTSGKKVSSASKQ